VTHIVGPEITVCGMEVGAEEEGNDDWGNPTSDDIPSIARVVSVHSKSSVLDESIEARYESLCLVHCTLLIAPPVDAGLNCCVLLVQSTLLLKPQH